MDPHVAGKDLLHLQCHEFLHEHPWVPWQMFPFMVETEPGSGVWRLPEPYDQRLPVLYSRKAAKD